MVALIPARAGSKRCPGKNTRLLNGHPLIAYTIAAARESGVFDEIYVCSDDPAANGFAIQNGVTVMFREPSSDDQADIVWVKEALAGVECDAFAILRPTSPFRTAATIRRCFEQFKKDESHSTRAVSLAPVHPGKMWWNNGPGYPMTPVCDAKRSDGTPWHSCPTQTLPPVYIQNASLEMAWTYVVNSFGTISGRKISPFLTEGYEGFDINTESDWAMAEVIASDRARLGHDWDYANHREI